MKPLILIVEDEDVLAHGLASVLEDEGYDTHTARHGGDALARASERLPQLVLLDLMLPRVDGAEFLRRAGEVPGLEQVPVVVMTSASRVPEAPQVKGLLRKPFHLAQVLDAVARALAPEAAR